MKERLKNIKNLSKVFIKENETKLKILNPKIYNTKSILFWMFVIVFVSIQYISQRIVSNVIKYNAQELFLNGFFLFLEILIIIKTVMVSTNLLYSKKGTEYILHLPFKPIEILISKFITLIFMNYETELIFGSIPLFVYGINLKISLAYYFNLMLILIMFPIFIALIVNILIMLIMKLFKNRNISQFIVICMAMIIFYTISNKITNNFNQYDFLNSINKNIIEINKYFFNVNPSIQILKNTNIFIILYNYLKIAIINIIAFFIFIFLGNKIYLKQLLKNNLFFENKRAKKVKVKRMKKKNIGFSYIKKEFKMILRRPTFLIRSILPMIFIMMFFIIIFILGVTTYRYITNMEEYKEKIIQIEFDIEAVCIIIGVIQFINLFNYTSITAISREGKDAYFMKLLPINYYKQIIYKSIPQIFINTVCSIIILYVIKLHIPEIRTKYIFIIFSLSFLLTLINSIILILIDSNMPNFDWNTESEILKNNKNKLLQYVVIIFNILFLMYIKKLFYKENLDMSLNIFMTILFFMVCILNCFIWKYKNKLLKKIR